MFMIPVVVILFGFFFLKMGFKALENYKKVKTESFEIVRGTIVDMIEVIDRSPEGSTVVHYPVLNFTYRNSAHSIKTKEYVSKRKSNRPPDGKRFAIGDAVDVRICNSDVNTAIVNDENFLGLLSKTSVILFIVGALFMMLGLVLTYSLFMEMI